MQTHSAKSEIADQLRSFGVSLKEFLRDPSMVGSAFPASRRMIDKMLADVPWKEIDVFVEYGPGTGRFTEEALRRLGPHAKLVAIDTSPDFTRNLERQIRDRRLIAVAGSAQDVENILSLRGLDSADCILSGLPFSNVGRLEGRAIMDASWSVLATNGHFLAYQMRKAIRPLLDERFHMVSESFEWRNVPPCHLYMASRPRHLARRRAVPA
ncbi:methyltransferase domain-containing protein [Sphingobium sufflavum]|uniref:class I SAM-dependent methyltransferase n=1 Tax=Sphingobium sufflavum TaxID=1129547 RepID=UPI001F258B40|nr:methyltransferase domain-containing protein [Sphingobium sufflavum]MCE7798173.1 methyltransferase domain-containing protein [Sphingobium sufflavum]